MSKNSTKQTLECFKGWITSLNYRKANKTKNKKQ